ncbi:MAG: rhodanese-like domain-containing protein [Kiloniellales bacterium]|nr:rhodanese-like domain-containing protein [Kiloniellales bacterium]
MGDFFMDVDDLVAQVGTMAAPVIFDVRRREAFEADGERLPAARWRNHQEAETWSAALPPGGDVLVYCVHGHQVSQSAAALLRAEGLHARVLRGGIEAWRNAGGPVIRNGGDTASERCEGSRWTLSLEPGAQELACFWLVRRFLDPNARALSLEAAQGQAGADELDARCLVTDRPEPAFPALLDELGLADPSLRALSDLLGDAGSTPFGSHLFDGLAAGPGVRHSSPDASLALFDALYRSLRRHQGDAGA